MFDRFNLRVNITKTQEFNTESLHHTPMKILGSYVGGTTNSQTNPTAVNFVSQAATRLQDRLDLLDPLTIQERLLLLRLCFFPVLGYLIRTMHPNLTLDGAVEFDRVVVGAIARWSGTVPENLLPTSVSIIHLPTKHGGLGLFQQQQIRKFAFSSSFVLCQSVLRARKIPLSSATYTDLSEFTKLCASNLDLPTDELLDDAQALCPHIQRRACDLLHERTWKTTYTALDTVGRLRFAEGTCPLARSWLQVFPSEPNTTIPDECAKYAIRKTLLLPLHQTSTNQVCSCGKRSSVLHHLVCKFNGKLRTFRHTYLLDIMLRAFKKIGGAEKEVSDGSLRHDICATGVGHERLLIDVGVTTVEYNQSESYFPSSQ